MTRLFRRKCRRKLEDIGHYEKEKPNIFKMIALKVYIWYPVVEEIKNWPSNQTDSTSVFLNLRV